MIIQLVEIILEGLTGDDHLYPRPFESIYKFTKRLENVERKRYSDALWKMQRRGLIKITNKNGQKFIKCTQKGQMQHLLKTASVQKTKSWDGKWRLIIFDIPESSRDKRNVFRRLLRNNGFYKIQASVFINPYALNRSAISYLKQSGLMDYIRILKVEEVDDDKALKKHFGLT